MDGWARNKEGWMDLWQEREGWMDGWLERKMDGCQERKKNYLIDDGSIARNKER